MSRSSVRGACEKSTPAPDRAAQLEQRVAARPAATRRSRCSADGVDEIGVRASDRRDAVERDRRSAAASDVRQSPQRRKQPARYPCAAMRQRRAQRLRCAPRAAVREVRGAIPARSCAVEDVVDVAARHRLATFRAIWIRRPEERAGIAQVDVNAPRGVRPSRLQSVIRGTSAGFRAAAAGACCASCRFSARSSMAARSSCVAS